MGGNRSASPPRPAVTVVLVAVGLAFLAAAAPVLASHAKTDVVTTDDGSVYNGEIKRPLLRCATGSD